MLSANLINDDAIRLSAKPDFFKKSSKTFVMIRRKAM